jgi:16S rRNA (cytosine967-C5)-methyltransferase
VSGRAPLSREIALAAAAIAGLRSGRSLPVALAASLPADLPPESVAAVRDIAYGTTRRLGLIDALLAKLNHRPPAPALAALQAVVLSQLLEPLRPVAIIVDQAVEAARVSGSGGAAGFLNATLRRFLREREALMGAVADDPVARWNHPQWWIDELRRDYPDDWQSILSAADAPPPMTLRVNRRRLGVGDCLRRLEAAGWPARQVGAQAVLLERPAPVERLPGWADGDLVVQDAGAQLAAALLSPRPGDRVLDACAGPGGKTTHLLEWADCDLTALDLDESRLAPVRENLRRLGQRARVVEGDAMRPSDWWDGRRFDRILVDAPCTASGIVRRHPDIRWLRRRGDIATLSERQRAILASLWPLLGPGGKLLYATCSVFAAENESVVSTFLSSHPDAVRQFVSARLGERDEPISQLLPYSSQLRDHDGFYYALLEKRS